ncbi:MAG: phosphoribosylanthranilate isomerase [Arenicellales bacterium]|nr:phosphoribosylanthranilate isomerase [Arenicellales bacterium]
MSRTRVKVCCISSLEEARLATKYGVDALGLVGHMPSGPGIVNDDLVREIAMSTPPVVETFLLTSHADGDTIADHVEYCATTTVQIVRHIRTSEYPTIIKRLPTIRRIQVIHVEDEGAIDLVRHYEPFVHAFLLDSGRPSASVAELGGTGRAHDWKISAKIVTSTAKPVFLAGGLTPENVSEAIETVAPFGVDVCSGLRTDSLLDEQKLREFVGNIRRSNHQ